MKSEPRGLGGRTRRYRISDIVYRPLRNVSLNAGRAGNTGDLGGSVSRSNEVAIIFMFASICIQRPCPPGLGASGHFYPLLCTSVEPFRPSSVSFRDLCVSTPYWSSIRGLRGFPRPHRLRIADHLGFGRVRPWRW